MIGLSLSLSLQIIMPSPAARHPETRAHLADLPWVKISLSYVEQFDLILVLRHVHRLDLA